jgi:hypothetical protein
VPTTVSASALVSSLPESAGNTAAFAATRDNTSGGLAINFTLTGTATNGSDYTASGVVFFNPGSPTALVMVDPTDDGASEPTESLVFTITSGTGYTVGSPSSASITILDNDAQLVSVAKVSDAEEGGTDGVFQFTRIGNLSSSLTANYSVGGTATGSNDVDYQQLAGTVTFAVGSSTATVQVAAIHDGVADDDETVVVTVTSGTGYSVGSPSSATVTIADDPIPLISVEKISDGTEGGADGVFRLTRSDYLTSALTVYYSVGGSASGEADEDYDELTGSVTFAANAATADVTVSVTNDSVTEYDESVTLYVYDGVGYSPGSDSVASLDILDNETPIVRVEKTGDALEGDWSGGFWFVRMGDTSEELVVNYIVSGTATSGTDYTALSGTITFAAGELFAELEVEALDESSSDPNETVTVTIDTGTGYAIDDEDSATVTIIDAATPFITVETIDDAEEGGGDGLFRFTRSGSTSGSLTVYYTVGGDASSGTDFTALSGSVTFGTGEATADVTVTPTNDSDDEPTEWVTVDITPNSAYAVSAASAVVALIDNDLPVVTVAKVVDAAETGGKGLFRFTRTGGDISGELTVNYTVGGSAAWGTDYASLSGTVTFGAGELTADVVINPVSDVSSESTETITVTLTSGSGYTVGTGSPVSMDLREESAGAISGRFWADEDGDGVEDGGEQGMANNWVSLLKDGEFIAMAETDASGNYSFSSLTAGTYTVLFDVRGLEATVTEEGEHTVPVTPGTTSTDISEGCRPPENAPEQTKIRDGIDWTTLDLTKGTRKTWSVGGVKGIEYEVKTVSGTTIKVFVHDPVATQPPAVLSALGPQGLDIRYNCHGFALNARNVTLADGRTYDFLIGNAPANEVLEAQYTKTDVTPDVARKALADGKRVLLAFSDGTGLIHTAQMKVVSVKDGVLDARESRCDSKNGFQQFAAFVTVGQLRAIYPGSIQLWIEK